MTIAYFDCQFGAAGDMLLGALMGAGLDEKRWRDELSKIALPQGSFAVKVSDAMRCNIASKKVDVICGAGDHHHDEERHLSEILEIIEASKIAAGAKRLAAAIFTLLGEAEAQVHGMSIDEVHFHEVGAIDAIVDIVGFAIGYELLGIKKSFVSALPLGSGTVNTRHGLFPVPGPAVVRLISEAGAPTLATDIKQECLTPTGAAILCAIAEEWGKAPGMKVAGTGYGAGSLDPAGYPNIVRVMVGEAVDASGVFNSDEVAVIEANLDDFSPQALSYVVEKLFGAGALDVLVLPAVMKKGRSGHMLTVIAKPQEQAMFEELILRGTSTLGMRTYMCRRVIADREWREVALSKGQTVRVKIGRDRLGRIINAQPEYEDCASYASKYDVPLKDVLAETMQKAKDLGLL